MNRKQARKIAQQAIAKAKQSTAGWWCISYNRRGEPVRMFVPAAT